MGDGIYRLERLSFGGESDGGGADMSVARLEAAWRCCTRLEAYWGDANAFIQSLEVRKF
jgi:hypothetical protein